jgi:hypothetical protein
MALVLKVAAGVFLGVMLFYLAIAVAPGTIDAALRTYNVTQIQAAKEDCLRRRGYWTDIDVRCYEPIATPRVP